MAAGTVALSQRRVLWRRRGEPENVKAGRPGGRAPDVQAAKGGGSKGTVRSQKKQSVPINDRIQANEVRLLDQSKEQVGVVPKRDALQRATDEGVDLILISSGDPPVCQLKEFGKFKYEQEKREKEARRKQLANRTDLKELKVRYNIGEADYNVRVKSARKFLSNGDRVKVMCQLRGREIEYKDKAIEVFNRLAEDCADVGKVEQSPRAQGRQVIMYLIGSSK